ncbi:MAG: ATP-binding protein [Actinomycetota bacterium]
MTTPARVGGRVTDRGEQPERHTELRLPHASTAGAEARREVGRRLRGVLSLERLADATLLTDELVTNAIRHARPEPDGSVGLRIEVARDCVRIAVTDGSPRFEWATRAAPDLAGGFGLLLVDRVSDRWGLSLDGKKAVWFEIDVPAGARRSVG